MLKCYRWGGSGPCDISVSLSPFVLDVGTLDLGLTTNELLAVLYSKDFESPP